MNYTKKEVMRLVEEVLGDNPEGLFINYDYLTGDSCDAEIECQITNGSFDIDYSLSGYDIRAGATKICIVPKNTHIDWVIKIPFTGVWSENEDGGKEIIGKFNVNYIEEEIDIYERADFNIKKFFAENVYVDDYHGIPIYIQQRINKVFAESNHSYNYRSNMNSRLVKNMVFFCGLCWGFIFDMTLSYGLKITNELTKFIRKYCDDLHDENYGYTKNGTPMIIDYGGFDSCECWFSCTDKEYFDDMVWN